VKYQDFFFPDKFFCQIKKNKNLKFKISYNQKNDFLSCENWTPFDVSFASWWGLAIFLNSNWLGIKSEPNWILSHI